MSVIKFDRDFETLFNWDTDDNPTTEQDYQNAVKNWTETEMNIVDTLLWQPTTEYATGNIVKTPSLPSQYVLRCAEAGTSGSTEPDYSGAGAGDTVTDGTVEWVIVSLATGNAADVDAGNIGVNAEVDNSEAWASAIGGGAIAEDDGRLVTGDTVHAVTSVMETNIATNTEAIEDNTEAIATNTANIEASAVKIDIDDKRISNIEKLLQGNLYDYQTDSDSKYVKTVPAGAMPYASLDSVGGKTLVWNQLVDSGTTTVATISGHKYYTLINGTASIVTADGTAITIVDDTADMVCDLTLMFGSGNEPSTTADFIAIFGATHYSYNAGTLLAAGVTEVVSKGKNLAYYGDGLGVPSNTSYSNTTKRFFPVGKYYTNLTANNYYNSNRVTVTAQGTSLTVTSVQSGYGCAIPFDCIGGADYSFSFTASASATVLSSVTWYDKSGGYISFVAGSTATSYKVTAPSNAEHGFLLLRTNEGSPITFDKIQIEKSSTATAYSPYQEHTYPIPAEVQALEGYGWSAGSVYNYIDYEAKKFVKRVASVDLGSLTWTTTGLTNPNVWKTTNALTEAKAPATPYDIPNAISSKYTTDSYLYTGGGSRVSGNITIIFATSGDGKKVYICDDGNYADATAFKSAMNGVYLYYELATPIETDISAYITDDNLISVESGGTLTFPNSNGTDYQIPVPSAETYMVDLQSAI